MHCGQDTDYVHSIQSGRPISSASVPPRTLAASTPDYRSMRCSRRARRRSEAADGNPDVSRDLLIRRDGVGRISDRDDPRL